MLKKVCINGNTSVDIGNNRCLQLFVCFISCNYYYTLQLLDRSRQINGYGLESHIICERKRLPTINKYAAEYGIKFE